MEHDRKVIPIVGQYCSGQGTGHSDLWKISLSANAESAASWNVVLKEEQRQTRVISLDLDFYSHPRMNAALKVMSALRQACDQGGAALDDSRPGHGYVRKAGGAL
jgi:hypothetical protein